MLHTLGSFIAKTPPCRSQISCILKAIVHNYQALGHNVNEYTDTELMTIRRVTRERGEDQCAYKGHTYVASTSHTYSRGLYNVIRLCSDYLFINSSVKGRG